MTLLSFMPARCWIAPLMPQAMYRLGATILPVWPTCQSFGAYPASTAARLAPSAAPSLSASGVSTSLNLSPEPSARPPLTMILAAVSSGRSLLAISLPTYADSPLSATAATVSIAAEPPSPAASKPVVRTVMTLMVSRLCTVAIALPA
jgi:hypothetical protein